MSDDFDRPVYAVIPAAGASRRMGRNKLLMLYRGQAVIDRVICAVREGGAKGMVVVAGQAVAEHLEQSPREDLAVVRNDDPNTEMIDSVRLGLGYWQSQPNVFAHAGYLVTPADYPALLPASVACCITAYRQQPDKLIIASYQGKRGHPLILPPPLCDEVFSPLCDDGLRDLLEAHADRIVQVETESAGTVQDVDTPEDFKRLEH